MPSWTRLCLALLFPPLACGESREAPAAAAGAGGSFETASAGAAGRTERAGSNGALPGESGAAGVGGAVEATAGRTGGGGSSSAGAGGAGIDRPVSLLVFSRTVGYRHDSIAAGVQSMTKLAADHGWTLAATEDASRFTDATLAGYDAVVFLSTTGDVLNDAQQAAFERFIRAGNGFIGIHSATDTEYDWAWYGGLVGAYFREHPAVQPASVVVEDATNPATLALPNPWRRTDEWYSFKSNPRPDVHVLLSLDESSYAPGASNMSGDHPIAWCHEYDGGRAFYSALGHTSESYSDPVFMAQLAGAVTWVRAR